MPFIDDSVTVFEGDFREIENNIKELLSKKKQLINYAAKTDLKTNEIHELRKVHAVITEQAVAIGKNQQELSRILNSKTIPLLQKRDRYVNNVLNLVRLNKNLLVQLKAICKDSNETNLYLEMHDKHAYWHSQATNTTEHLNSCRQNSNSFYKASIKQYKGIIKSLKNYSKFESYTYSKYIQDENFRHNRYKIAGQNGISIDHMIQSKSAGVMQLLKQKK